MRPPAPSKIKILKVADDLFYYDGVHTVGVDRIIATAAVTKATFYKHYRSKDLLITAYVHGRDVTVHRFFEDAAARGDDPKSTVRALADAIAAEAARPGYRGCPFINAATQFPNPAHPVRVAVAEHREWYSRTIEDLFRKMCHPAPGDAADDVLLARDGALGGGQVSDPITANAALHRTIERVLAEAR